MNYGNSFRFEILRSKQVFQEQKRDLAGFAFMNPDEDFYTLKLLFLPGISYYLVRQKEKDGYYTIFSKCFQLEGGKKFVYSVGYAKRMTSEGPMIELYFKDLKGPYYLHLQPVANSQAQVQLKSA